MAEYAQCPGFQGGSILGGVLGTATGLSMDQKSGQAVLAVRNGPELTSRGVPVTFNKSPLKSSCLSAHFLPLFSGTIVMEPGSGLGNFRHRSGLRWKILTGHNTHNNVLLGDPRVQIIHSHLGAFQRAEDRLPQTRVLPEGTGQLRAQTAELTLDKRPGGPPPITDLSTQHAPPPYAQDGASCFSMCGALSSLCLECHSYFKTHPAQMALSP